MSSGRVVCRFDAQDMRWAILYRERFSDCSLVLESTEIWMFVAFSSSDCRSSRDPQKRQDFVKKLTVFGAMSSCNVLADSELLFMESGVGLSISTSHDASSELP